MFGTEQKAVESGVASSDTQPRGSIDKAYYPGFLVKPPFGWPKYKNVYELRRLAATPQAAMAIQTIVDEITAVPWKIVPKEGLDLTDSTPMHVDEIKQFFDNPNSSKESFEKILKVIVRELLTLDSGIIVKEFNKLQKLTEIKATDSAGFLKNPNQFGKIDGREDFMLEGFVDYSGELSASAFVNMENESRPGGISVQEAQTKAAYFQYGYLTSARPVPFGKREIIWMEKNPLSYDIYGLAPIETILDVLQTLIYSIQYNLEYFEDNNVPKGFIQLAGGNEEDLKAFGERWNDLQYKKDKLSGRLRKMFHRVPITNSMNAQFVKVQFSAQELELISSQTWFTKLVWGAFGVTPSEVGFTEDSNRATEIAQSRVFKRKAIFPMLRLIEYHINKELISEWEYDDVEFKFTTFDVDEEKAKWDLYKIQLDTKTLTINEIRLQEGMDEVEWGDNPENDQFGTGEEFDFGELEDDDIENENEKLNKDSESKNLTTQSPITLGENELISKFNKTLNNIEKQLLKVLTQEAKKDRLTQIKSIDGIADNLDKINLEDQVKSMVDQTIKNFYEKGWDLSEKQLKMNLQMNLAQVNFIQKYTFGNVKGLNDDLKNKLRQEIRRSIIDGEGIGKLAPRIKNVFNIEKVRAHAIARTELNRAFGQGQLQAMKASGRKMTKTWDAHLDGRTSAICKALDGKTVDLNEKFKYKGEEFDSNPAHVNCRSRIKYNVQSEPESKDLKKNKEVKHKYIKRTGRPGDYTYFYRNGTSSKKPKQEKEDNK